MIRIGFDRPCASSDEVHAVLLRMAWSLDPNLLLPLLLLGRVLEADLNVD